MHELGSASGTPRRDTDRYRSDIVAAVAMATPDGRSFERLLGAERAAPARERTAPEPRRPETPPAERPGRETPAERSEARADRAAPADDGEPGPEPRRATAAAPRPGAALRSGVDLPARAQKLAAAADAETRDVADYARLLERVRGTLETVTGREPARPGEAAVERSAAAPAPAGGAIPVTELAAAEGFDPAAALMKSLAPDGEPALPKAPAPAAPEPPQIPSAEIRAQVAQQLTGKLGGLGGKGTLKFELTPPELGRVEIRFTREGDRLHLLFRVETAAAARALQEGSGHLQELLLGRNGHWSQIEVTVVKDEEAAEGRRERRQDDRDPSRRDGDEDGDRREKGDER